MNGIYNVIYSSGEIWAQVPYPVDVGGCMGRIMVMRNFREGDGRQKLAFDMLLNTTYKNAADKRACIRKVYLDDMKACTSRKDIVANVLTSVSNLDFEYSHVNGAGISMFKITVPTKTPMEICCENSTGLMEKIKSLPTLDLIPPNEFPDNVDEISKLMIDQNNYMIDFLIKE